jgi:hypothetical protein
MLHGFVRLAGSDFAVSGGRDNFVWEFGSVIVWATTLEATTIAGMVVAATTATTQKIVRAGAHVIQRSMGWILFTSQGANSGGSRISDAS